MEKVGDISGFDIKVKDLKELLLEETISEISDSWAQWLDGLVNCLANRSNRWVTIGEEEANIYKEYVENFTKDVLEVLDSWIEESVVQTILKPKIDRLDSEFFGKLAAIRQDLQSIDDNTGTVLHKQFELSGMGSNLEFRSEVNLDMKQESASFWEGVGFIIGGVAAVPLIPIYFLGGFMGLLGDTTEDMKKEIRMKVLDKGIDEFLGGSEEISEKIFEYVESAFEHKVQDFHKAASASISILCNLLEQQESILKETLAEKEAESKLIQQKSLQLKAIETALENLTKAALG